MEKTKPYRQRRLEALETRVVLDGTLGWTDNSQLTLSFAHDGTDIGGEPSSLFALFQEQGFREDDWQNAILTAFQTWAAPSTANVGLVDEMMMHRDSAVPVIGIAPDDVAPVDETPADGNPDHIATESPPKAGFPFGEPGPRNHDGRFGDIRIGARQLSEDVKALAIASDTVTAGTWSGDVLFNSSADFASIDEVFGIALHEAGHVFGLDESEDPVSPMLPGADPPNTVPTSDDRFEISRRHGNRAPDRYENSDVENAVDNNRIAQATQLETPVTVTSGRIPAMVFANLHATDDLDFYKFPAFVGEAKVELRTIGISLLAPQLQIYQVNNNEDGTLSELMIFEAKGTERTGDRIQIALEQLDENAEYFLRVSASDHADVPDLFGVGSYTLAVQYTRNPVIEASSIRTEIALRNSKYDWSLDEFDSVARNDAITEATVLEFPAEVMVGDQVGIAYADFHNGTDADFYRLPKPAQETGSVRVFLQNGEVLQAPKWQVLVINSLNEVVRRVSPAELESHVSVAEFRIHADHEYYVQATPSDAAVDIKFGSYALAVAYRPDVELNFAAIQEQLLNLDMQVPAANPRPDRFDQLSPNETISAASVLPLNENVRTGKESASMVVNFHNAADVDFYRFSGIDTGSFQIHLQSGKRATDVELNVYAIPKGADLNSVDLGSVLVSSNRTIEGNSFDLGESISSDTNVEYFLRATAIDPSDLPGAYAISIVFRPELTIDHIAIAENLNAADRLVRPSVPDALETENGNDSVAQAVALDPPETAVAGIDPWTFYSDLHATDDVDFFRLPFPEDAVGTIKLQLHIGDRLRTPSLEFYRLVESNAPAAEPEYASVDANVLALNATSFEVELEVSEPGTKYFVRIGSNAPDGSPLKVGYYGLVITQQARVDDDTLDAVAIDSARQLSQAEIAAVVEGELIREDEDGVIDSPATAIILKPRPGFTEFTTYETFGSISSSDDIDYFSIVAPSRGNDGAPIYIQSRIQSLPASNRYPGLLVSHGGSPMPSEVLVNGTGEYVLQTELEPGKHYVLSVRARPLFERGNYLLTVYFTDDAVDMFNLASATLGGKRESTQRLDVNQTKLSHFALHVDQVDLDSAGSGRVRATIFDTSESRREPIQRLASAPGITRTSISVLLDPGTYEIEFQLLDDQGMLDDSDHLNVTLTGQSSYRSVSELIPRIQPATTLSAKTDQAIATLAKLPALTNSSTTIFLMSFCRLFTTFLTYA